MDGKLETTVISRLTGLHGAVRITGTGVTTCSSLSQSSPALAGRCPPSVRPPRCSGLARPYPSRLPRPAAPGPRRDHVGSLGPLVKEGGPLAPGESGGRAGRFWRG